MASGPDVARTTVGDLQLLVCTSPALRLVSACVSDAVKLSVADLQRATIRAYEQVRKALSTDRNWYPLRFWNYIPDIHALVDNGLDRYMVFNAGRFTAFADWYGGVECFANSVATASGLGHSGRDLFIHVLAGRIPGQHVENPRQISSYNYSERYGPLPPCFARATLARLSESDRPLLLIGGTSSVRGETSVENGNAVRQTRETLQNLSTLITTALRPEAIEDGCDAGKEALAQLSHVRVYVRHNEDVSDILATLKDWAPHLKLPDIEVFQADICRPELLVEIEGTAALELDT
jgi:chorismate lyase / 3-hydroxybenzoate synthase